MNEVSTFSDGEDCEDCESLEKTINNLLDASHNYKKHIERLESKLKTATEALEFYAKKDKYFVKNKSDTKTRFKSPQIINDCGKTARQAIAKIKGE